MIHKTHDGDREARRTVNFTSQDEAIINSLLSQLQQYYGPTSQPPSVSMILTGVLKRWYAENGKEGVERLGNELQQACKKRSNR